jgi:hypothetical protein
MNTEEVSKSPNETKRKLFICSGLPGFESNPNCQTKEDVKYLAFNCGFEPSCGNRKQGTSITALREANSPKANTHNEGR